MPRTIARNSSRVAAALWIYHTFHLQPVFIMPSDVYADIYRMKDGKAAEHWDAIAPIAETTASGRSQVDGGFK